MFFRYCNEENRTISDQTKQQQSLVPNRSALTLMFPSLVGSSLPEFGPASFLVSQYILLQCEQRIVPETGPSILQKLRLLLVSPPVLCDLPAGPAPPAHPEAPRCRRRRRPRDCALRRASL